MTTSTAQVDSEGKTEAQKEQSQTEKFVAIDLDGGKVDVKESQKELVISNRAKTKQLEKDLLEAKTKLDKYESDKKTQEQKKLEQDAPPEKLAEIRAWHIQEQEKIKAQASAESLKWKTSSIKDKVSLAVKSVEDLVPTAATDVVKHIMAEYQFDINDKNQLVAVSDGKPLLAENGDIITVEAVVKKHVSERDWLKLHKGATGTKEKKIVTVQTEQSAIDLASMTPEQRVEAVSRGKIKPEEVTKFLVAQKKK